MKNMVIDESWYQRPSDIAESISAGGIVVRKENGQIYVALIREGTITQYVLPKGHLEAGETIEEAARREIEEEAGLSDLQRVKELGIRERLNFKKKSWKITHYFLFTTRQISGTPTDPTIKYQLEWFPLKDLPPIFWPEQRELIESNREAIEQCLMG